MTCPPDTVDYSYVIELGQCIKIEKGCVYSSLDGCLACREGFYLYNKQCYKYQLYQGLTTQYWTVKTIDVNEKNIVNDLEKS